jgi:hypothetical protein
MTTAQRCLGVHLFSSKNVTKYFDPSGFCPAEALRFCDDKRAAPNFCG